MRRKILFFSHAQLTLLDLFLDNKKRALGVTEITEKTAIKGESLGGLISSFVRTKYRGQSLIQPWGRDRNGIGMRWKINPKAINLELAQREVNMLLKEHQA
ncbi:MAG: hypothetical protein IT416_01220 [Candidatus Pacebacteria bacterium]|nr:hypothetical protein [Candidatus Paceibacterota bacterium]